MNRVGKKAMLTNYQNKRYFPFLEVFTGLIVLCG
jgi:hypothetical protein